jgi:subtilisin family serine protease
LVPSIGKTESVDFSHEGFVTNTPQIDSLLVSDFGERNSVVSNADEEMVSAILQFKEPLTTRQLQLAKSRGIEFVGRGSSIVRVGSVYSVRAPNLMSIQRLDEIGLLRASSGSKQYYPSLTTSVPAIGAPNVWHNLRKDNASINGTGTRIAIIDTGASWLHPSFWKQSTEALNVIQSGSRFYVDINSNSVADDSEGPISTVTGQVGSTISYEQDYMFIDINDDGTFQYNNGERWLGGIDANEDGDISLATESVVILGESKIAVLLDQENDVYVRGVNLTQATNVGDSYGHGTHVASTAAGGQPGMTSFVGVAPGADLIIIKSPLDSASIIEGIHFAVENEADVINMSFSSYLGFLDGTDLEDLAVSQAFIANGTLSTLAAGNLGGRLKHANFQCASGETAGTTLSVNNPPDNSFINILWQSDDDDEHVILTPPGDSEPIDIGEFGSITGSAYSLESDNISAYVFPDTSTRGTNRLIVQVSSSEHFWDSGTWLVSVSNPSGATVTVDAYAWDTQWHYTNLRFTSRVDNRRTISSPGTADLGVAVGSSSETGEGISSTSSEGPRIDGSIKPEVVAPGETINAARNSLSSLWTSKSGTSMAAPHVAGVIALIRQASGSVNGWTDLSSLYQGAGGAEDHYASPTSSWGYGLVNPTYSIQHFLNTSLPETNWNYIETLASDTEDPSVNDSLDILSVEAYHNSSAVHLRVGFDGVTNFSDDSVFTLEWDVDSSLATGPSGVDILLNVSSGQARAYQWTGSSFQLAPFAPDFFTELDYLYISVLRTQPQDRGRMRFRTSNSTVSTLDSLDYSSLNNQWKPIFSSISYESEGTEFDILISVYDHDTPIDELSIEASIVDGGLDDLTSQNNQADSILNWYVDIGELESSSLMSLIAMASDESASLASPPVMLSAELGTEVRFVSASLKTTQVRVGPFISDRISGSLTLEGHMFVDEVTLSFVPESGFTPNVTLSGNQGQYSFDISPSGFSEGEYSVVAIATLRTGEQISYEFATLRVVSDYSVVILLGVAAMAIVAIIILYPKIAERIR